jgi:hypothetical protein
MVLEPELVPELVLGLEPELEPELVLEPELEPEPVWRKRQRQG